MKLFNKIIKDLEKEYKDINFILCIDNREKKIIKLLSEIPDFIKFCNLDLGDFQIIINNEIKLIIERKTLADLGKSIRDGRLKEQRNRLIKSEKNILYIIEGYYDIKTILNENKIGNINILSLIGSQTNMIIRDQLQIYRSMYIEETIYFIFNILKKILKFDIKNKNNNKIDYIGDVFIRKKDNYNTSNCFVLQLAQIPGVSITIARAITNIYKSMLDLCIEYNRYDIDNKNRDKKFLSWIKYTTKNGFNRKIGKITSEKICKYLKNIDK